MANEVTHLRYLVDRLQKENLELKAKLREAESKVYDLKNKVELLWKSTNR